MNEVDKELMEFNSKPLEERLALLRNTIQQLKRYLSGIDTDAPIKWMYKGKELWIEKAMLTKAEDLTGNYDPEIKELVIEFEEI